MAGGSSLTSNEHSIFCAQLHPPHLDGFILRHSYLSHKYGKVNQEKEKDADIMGHSISTQSDYVKKD